MKKLFISHATEDKETFVRHLAGALRSQGVDVWYDDYSLTPGDSLRNSINKGLSESDIGLVVLSNAFFNKGWANYELDVLHSKRMKGNKVTIVPIWFQVGLSDIEREVPGMATIVGITVSGIDDLDRVVDQLHTSIPEAWPTPIERNLLSSGCSTLNRLMRGGIPRPSSVALIGPEGIGKSLLGIQILQSALQDGLPSMYISYKESPIDIYNWMAHRNPNVLKHTQGKGFKIFDVFSSRHGISENEVLDSLPQEARHHLVYVQNPLDVDEYISLQESIHDEIGYGGINIIDSVNDRMRIFENESNPTEAATAYFLRMRSRLSRIGGQSAIHIQDSSLPDKYANILQGRQDGSIMMRRLNAIHGHIRQLRISHLRGLSPDTRWHEFIINNKQVTILPRHEP